MTPLLFWLIAVAVVGIIMLLIEAIIAIPASAAQTDVQQDSIKKVLFPCWMDDIVILHGTYDGMDKYDENGNLVEEEVDTSGTIIEGRIDENGKPITIRAEYDMDYFEGITKEESHQAWKAQDSLCPFLSPERYRRRVKMFYGIDVNDYPPGVKIQLTELDRYEVEQRACLSLYPALRSIEPVMWINYAKSTEYPALYNKWLFMGYTDAFYSIRDFFWKQSHYYKDYNPHHSLYKDVRYAQYDAGIFDARDELLEFMDTTVYLLEPNYFVGIADGYLRYTDLRMDALYMYIHRQQAEKNRKLWLPYGRYSYAPNDSDKYKYIFMNTEPFHGWNSRERNEEKISRMLAHEETPWKGYVPEAGVAAFLNFLLRIGEGESLVSGYSGMLSENNYFGYGLLREFCEGRWRYSSLRAKMLESYKAKPLTDGVKLWLEPHPWAFDIDILKTTDELTVTELGYDDYYFAEVMLPVESPVRDENGYAKILDRKEKVKGYVKRSEIAIVEKLKEGEGLPHENTDAWKKNPYLLLYMEKYRDKMTALTGALSVQEVVNIDCDMRAVVCDELMDDDTFLYWEAPERPEYVIVQSDFNIRGFVAKSKVRQVTEENMNTLRIVPDLAGDAELLKQVNPRISSRRGIIEDPDGYVNIRESRSVGSKILGTIRDGELFTYWELSGNWYIVQTAQGLRGFVHKTRIREYFNPQRWTISNE
ncbi:MAG: SH3 domain-containing protein [Prevotellaceae bacterium]|nr:SH3 domain-containing protein [Prevotellaceae bacterium]